MHVNYHQEVIGAKGFEKYLEDRWVDGLEREREMGKQLVLTHSGANATDAEVEECASCLAGVWLTVPPKATEPIYECFKSHCESESAAKQMCKERGRVEGRTH